MAVCQTVVLALAGVAPASGQGISGAATTSGTGSLVGAAYDSVSGMRAAGARVWLTNTPFSTTTDSAGRYVFDSVPAGRYSVELDTPVLDSLGVTLPPKVVTVDRARTDTVDLSVPSMATLFAAACPVSKEDSSAGMVIGTVRDASDGTAVSGAVVTFAWTTWILGQHAITHSTRQAPVTTDERGTYAICGVPGEATIAVQARSGRRHSGTIELAVPASRIVRRDLSIGANGEASSGPAPTPAVNSERDNPLDAVGEPAGSATLISTVRDAGGKPIASADVELAGTDFGSATTDASGVAKLAGLPTGTWDAQVRRLGFAPARASVELLPHKTSRVTIVLRERVTALKPVHVLGQKFDPNGFAERAAHGNGAYFFDRAAIEKIAPHKTTDILRRVPAIELVIPDTAGDPIVQMRRSRFSDLLNAGHCPVKYYLDGVPFDVRSALDFWIQPDDIEAIEIYPGGSSMPSEFGGASSGCGVIAFWTRSRAGKDTDHGADSAKTPKSP